MQGFHKQCGTSVEALGAFRLAYVALRGSPTLRALDALSVGPLYDAEVTIGSRCHITGEPIHVRQIGKTIVDAQPVDTIVGVRWQNPTGCAAHSMCTEMVFLKNSVTAHQWQSRDPDSISLFNLAEAVEFGAAFFVPLVRP